MIIGEMAFLSLYQCHVVKGVFYVLCISETYTSTAIFALVLVVET